MEAKYMKTSYSKAWECEPFDTCISDISTYKEYGHKITKPTSYIQAWASHRLNQAQAPLQQVRHHMAVWGMVK